MPEFLRGMLKSKKAAAWVLGTVATTLVALGHHLGLPIPPEVAQELAPLVAGLAMSYIAGQGAADWGKEARRLEETASR